MLRTARILSAGYLVLTLIVTLLTATTGPLGTAPFPLPIGPARDPLVVTIAYGTEKRDWLEEAARRFDAQNRRVNGRPIRIELQGIGSRELVSGIVAGTLQPTVVSPASSLWIELLRAEWEARNGTQIVRDGADGPQPLVLTPLVLVAWQQRAAALWPNGPERLWQELHDAIADPRGWDARGHPEWGLVKFGHTSPLSSNSGTQTLILLAYAYHNKTSGLSSQDVLDPEFQRWMEAIELGVLEFGDSTGTFMDNMVRYGPSKYDFVAVYENLALENIEAARGRWGDIQVMYPPATMLSDHPYAILDAPWVAPEQAEAAAVFRDYLLGREAQELALQAGFRPANPEVAVIDTDPNNPFNRFAAYGVQVDIQQQVQVPPADVINTLIDLWRRRINR